MKYFTIVLLVLFAFFSCYKEEKKVVYTDTYKDYYLVDGDTIVHKSIDCPVLKEHGHCAAVIEKYLVWGCDDPPAFLCTECFTKDEIVELYNKKI